MSKLFLHLLNISITAGWIVLVVVLLRFVLKKAPKWTRVVLWGLVALRLILPVSIESPLSLVPSEQTVSIATWTLPDTAVGTSEEGSAAQRTTAERVVFQTGFPALNSAINPTMKQSYEHHSTVSTVKTVAGWVWLAGVVGMLFYALISFLRLRHRVRASVKSEKGVYVCDEISDPFILGLIVPKIYLPSGMDEQTRAYVLAHERAHLKRFDHIWKPLGFLLLSVYWFNPLLWLAYILLCRDIELACDEKVIRELDDTGKAAYSEALVTASVSRRSIAACPLAFGETGVKSRVKSVLNYKKPAFWIILVAILACIAVAVCFLTMPKKDATITELSEEIQKINGTLPGNTFLYLYRDNTSYFCYSLNGENGCGTSDAYYDKPFDLFAEIRQGIITVDHDPAHIKEITRFIHDTSIGFIQNTITGSKQYSAGLFEQVLPLYTQDWHKCREIKLKENDADFPVSKGSNAYYTLNENGFELYYYGHSDKGNDNVSSMLLYIEVPDLEAVIERFAPSAASDKTPIPTASFDSITGSDAKVLQWLDYFYSSDMPWDGTKEITHDAFPNVTFRWTAGSVEAIENGKTRTLFSGMPVWSVYFADLTGDGKPELIATVSFGSGIVDEHIVVYDYANKQSYVLWDRMQFDFHLYTVDGALYVGKTPYMGDKQVDYGTLTMHDGVLSCRWQSDGSYMSLYPELHESELIGEWLVEEEKDSDSNVLYTFPQNDLWKEYNFREDGTVVYNETVPISSDYEKAFGHPVEYPYEVHNDCVYIAGDDTSGAFCWGTYDRETHRLTLTYNTPDGTVYATLRRMGEDLPETDAQATPDPTKSSDLSKEQADAFVNGLSVEFEDGSPYGCDLVVFIDGFGTCLNVGDPNAFERASLRYELLSRNNQNGSIDYAKILSVGELPYYIGDITVFADGDRLVYGEEWNDEYPSADASILVPVNPLMMDRNQSCPERCCVIRSFDPVNRTVTVSFGLQEEMSADIPGEYVDYSSIETEQITLKVTDETFLTLIGNDFDTLVKPDRFFRFFEEYEFFDLYLFDENNGDASIGFWIGVDGDTLLYLCEMKEV